MKHKLYFLAALTAFSTSVIQSTTFNVNYFYQPYDVLFDPYARRDRHRDFEISIFGDVGIRSAQGYNNDQAEVNVLGIYGCTQNALKMLDGFDSSSAIGQLRSLIDADDNGTRGHVRFCGDFTVNGELIAAMHYYFNEYLALGVYLPFFSSKLSNVVWCDQTQEKNAEDLRVKEYLTDDLASVVCELGDIDLGGWTRNGVGDLMALALFQKNFPQDRPLIKDVRVNARVGLSLPSGLRENEDLLFAVPYGGDGSVGIIFGGALNVLLGQHFRIGFDANFHHLFGNTRNRRIKTAIGQTDLLLLQKVRAYKDWGLTQRFSLFAEAYNLYKGLSFLVGYEFFKHDDDRLRFNSCDFSQTVANTAQTLKERIMHRIVLNLYLDPSCYMDCNAAVWPYFSVYARIPYRGKNTALVPFVGGIVSFDF